MGVVPADRMEKIAYFRAHILPWSSNAVAIGLTSAMVTTLDSQVKSAEDLLIAANTAREASKAATKAWYSAVSLMGTTGSSYMTAIRAKAETTNNPNVYTLAQIPPPSAGSPVGPPGMPFMFRVGLAANGAVTLTWKCNNPANASGTVYEVRRRNVGSTGAFTFIGAVGSRTFTDDTVPSGPGVTYQVTGVRSTSRGEPAQVNVNFGVSGPGLTIASATMEDGSMVGRLAA